MAIPVIGQLIGALDLLTMAITFAIPGVEMFSPLTFVMEKLFNVTMDFVNFLSDLSLQDIIDGLTDSAVDRDKVMEPANERGTNARETMNNAIGGTGASERRNMNRSAPGTNPLGGDSGRPNKQINVNINGNNSNPEDIATTVMDRILMNERKERQFYEDDD
jgi:hypothetical protein